ncbi:transmembrane amino acid transporter protein-domain-containing protein [Chlamydoabsidia padenii]|nr:transmembrane amino acid transporter protein-domain-containing protein [Chlamydoabsidia padenii]
MDIPSSGQRGGFGPNPSMQSQHHSSRHSSNYNNSVNGRHAQDTPMSCSFSERIGSFVSNCSRTSLLYMAENVTVPSPHDNHYLFNHTDDCESIGSSIKSLSRLDSRGTLNEQTRLLYPTLHQVNTGQTHMSTIADTYQDSQGSYSQPAKSSFIQSVFNSVNILVGVGILALPLGFKYSGWILGSITFCFCLGLTNYTAKLLGRCLYAYPESQTYGDMAYNAFGQHGRIIVSVLFLTELITCSVALVVLLGDGLDSLFPGNHPFLIRVASFVILTPMVFIPVRHLSYSSLLGILSAVSVLLVIIVDGLTKPTSPGSLIKPADTTWWPSDWMIFPRSTGLIMAGFCGHACLATIYRDMQHPKQYVKMVNWTYIIAALIYLAVAITGYRMFGSDTMQEITQNLLLVPEYNQTLNRMAVYLIALNPIAKYGLTLNPVNISLIRQPYIQSQCGKQTFRGKLIQAAAKILVSALVVLLAYCIPDFDRIMSLLGACFSFIISGVFPILCYIKLFDSSISLYQKMALYILSGVCFTLAITGTVWSFI